MSIESFNRKYAQRPDMETKDPESLFDAPPGDKESYDPAPVEPGTSGYEVSPSASGRRKRPEADETAPASDLTPTRRQELQELVDFAWQRNTVKGVFALAMDELGITPWDRNQRLKALGTRNDILPSKDWPEGKPFNLQTEMRKAQGLDGPVPPQEPVDSFTEAAVPTPPDPPPSPVPQQGYEYGPQPNKRGQRATELQNWEFIRAMKDPQFDTQTAVGRFFGLRAASVNARYRRLQNNPEYDTNLGIPAIDARIETLKPQAQSSPEPQHPRPHEMLGFGQR